MVKKELKDKIVNAKITETKLAAFTKLCSLNDISVSEGINQLIDKALLEVKKPAKKKAKRE